MAGDSPIDRLDRTIYDLVPGRRYRVVQPFTDYYNSTFQAGELLRFKERHFLPYAGGHTLIFDERSIYLQEDQHKGILASFGSYMMPDQTGA